MDERVPDHSTIGQLRRLAVTDSTHVKANASKSSGLKIKVSSTDPEAGYMKRPGKPNGFYYLSHQTTDSDHGIITAVTVTPGDVHDSQPYLQQLDSVVNKQGVR